MTSVQPLPSQRRLFEIPDDVAYLNCAYMSPNLTAVRKAGQRAVAAKSRPWSIAPVDFFDDSERVREQAGELLGGDADGVAIVPSASYGIGVAAANLPVGPNERILVLDEQFPSNVYPWREVAASNGATVHTVGRPSRGRTWTDELLHDLDDDVAVVAVPHCHWTDGTTVDLDALASATRPAGAALVVDATQSLGALSLPVTSIRPDFLVAAAYKWLLGPYSLAFLWVHPDRREGTPLEYNWITRADSEDFTGLVDYRDDYQPGARRFDMGERSNFVLLPMAIAALEQLLDWGVDSVAATCAAHTSLVENATAELGLRPVPENDRAGHMLGIRFPGGVPDDLSARLHTGGVHVSVRGDSVRVSPHTWTTPGDLERLVEVLDSAVA